MIVWVHLKDEIPRLGMGIRRVEVIKLGWKWAHLRTPGKAHGVRVSRKVWDSVTKLEPGIIPVTFPPQ